jgi:16S rRNA (uracil1498-N3)-methyltransferase
MQRFFCSPGDIRGNLIILEGNEAHHIINVLRKKTSEIVEVCDGTGQLYQGEITEIEKSKVILRIITLKEKYQGREVEVELYQCLSKGEKMDFVIQKAVELGIDSITPVESLRSIVKADKEKSEKKLERWNKVALEATKQSKGLLVPVVNPIKKLKDIKLINEKEFLIIPYEGEVERTLHQVIENGITGDYRKISIIIGPEGGFEDSEIDYLKSIGGYTVTLGNRILRTETAAVAVMSVIMYRIGAFGKWTK